MNDALGEVTLETIDLTSADKLQSLGMALKKAKYIKDFCGKVLSGEFDLKAVEKMSYENAIIVLSALKGIGV